MKPIGIIGGAGPMAGVMFLQRLFSLAGSQYGCFRDRDFPEVMLLSFPFSEMLEGEIDPQVARDELKGCIVQLQKNGAGVIAIACNTLHAFLDEIPAELIHLPKAAMEEIPEGEIPLVLCTSTSAQFGLHKQFFPCIYPNAQVQEQVDQLINQILKGEEVTRELQQLIASQQERVIVLGCTELSLYTRALGDLNKVIVDPLEITAKKILEQSFRENICC